MNGKHMTKRGVGLLLALILCLSLLPVPGAHAEGETRAERQQALVATAYAFFDKGQWVQYDGTSLVNVYRSIGGKTRSTNECGPEFATEKETVYSVCSDFCYQTYFHAFGYRLCGAQGSCWTAALASPGSVPMDDPRLVYRYNFNTGELEQMPAEKVAEYGQPESIEAAIDKLLELAEPGDVITTIASSDSGGGHSVVYVGDVKGTGTKYIMHCYGGGIKMSLGSDESEDDEGALATLGRDTLEVPHPAPASLSDERYKSYSDANGGAIRLTAARSFLISSGGAGKVRTRITLLRPLDGADMADIPIPAATRTRMNYPRLSIDRTTDKSRFNSTKTGDTLNLYIKLKNSSDAAYTLPVTEQIPAGAALLSVSDSGTVAEDTISWSVPLAAGEEKTLTVSYKITASRGQDVVFGGGFVDNIPSNTIRVRVGGVRLTAAENAKLADIANGTYDTVLSAATDATLAKTVYENILGLDGVTFPDYLTAPGSLVETVNVRRTATKYTDVKTPKETITAADRAVYSMTVPYFYGGTNFWCANSEKRVLDTKAMYMEPGDVVVRLDDGFTPTACRTMVCIGDDQFVQLNESTGAPEIVNHKELVRSHTYGLFYALRPTLAYADLHDPSLVEKEMSLNLNDTVVINCYYLDEEERYTDDSYALVDGARRPVVKGGTMWYLPARESVAKEMGRVSTVQMVGVDAGGTEYPMPVNELSIRGYAEQMLGLVNWSNSKQAKLGRTMIGMLNYGAEAQKYFGYETDDLANKNLTETDQAKMTHTPANITEQRVNNRATDDAEGIYYASSCVLGSSQALRFYLHLPESRADRESLTFRARYKNYNGESRTVTKSFAELTESTASGIYYFEVAGMAAADVKTDVTLTVRKAGRVITTVTDSIASYCARVYASTPAVRDLTDAVLIYGLSARDYFYVPTPDKEENEMPMN